MKKLYFFDGIAWKNFLFLTLAGCINANGVTAVYDQGIYTCVIQLLQILGQLGNFLIARHGVYGDMAFDTVTMGKFYRRR